MAYIDVRFHVPDGDYCDNCGLLIKGTVVCGLFHEFVEETEDCNKIKCEGCRRSCREEGDNDE